MTSVALLQKKLQTDYIRDVELGVMLHSKSENALYLVAARLQKMHALMRLKNGFYVLGGALQQHPLNLLLVANHLYGPSYVSLETALSWHQLIPESTPTILSCHPKRTRQFQTSVGLFRYRKIPESAFFVGVTSVESLGKHMLIASPEKALLDKLYLDGASLSSPLHYLEESLRIEKELLTSLNWEAIAFYHSLYKNTEFSRRVQELRRKVEYL